MDPTVARNFAIALLIGALVGLEREKRKIAEPHIGVGGLRTFILFAEAGAVSAWLSTQLQAPWVFAAAVLAVAALVTAGYLVQTRSSEAAQGLTTEIAAVTVCLLGGACLLGSPGLAVALGITTSAVLAYKQPMHQVVGRLATDDLYAGLKLLIATFIVLPLLPNRTVDPWGALNPYALWWLVILISALSLVGYVAVRILGASRGTALTGLFGGLVSSTAVTLAFSRRSQEEGGGVLAPSLAAGILLAWGVMFVRVLVIVAVANVALVGRLVVPFIVLAGVCAVIAAMQLRGAGARAAAASASPAVGLTNPFSLTEATKFALFFAGVLLVVALARQYLPGQGLYVVAALAGLTDVDAISLSMAGYARTGGDPGVAVAAIVIAALSNTLVKVGLVAGLAAASLRSRTVVATAMLLAVAGVLLLAFR
jgi:uncharacterized membrane protein (DUF4010 family)